MNRIFALALTAYLTRLTFLTLAMLVTLPAFGQANAPPVAVAADGVAGGLSREAERARIQAERASVEDVFTQAQAACYRKFAVADCQSGARLVRREALADLRRQEASLNAAQARREGAEQLSRIDKKSSDQAGPDSASERANAAQKQEARQASADEKASARAAAEREASSRSGDQPQRVEKQAQAQADRAAKAAAAPVEQQSYDLKQKQAQEKAAQRRKRASGQPESSAKPLPDPARNPQLPL
jgi:colicin import membrane protein